MKRFVVERTWSEGLHIPMDSDGNGICQAVVKNNSGEEVFWVQSFVTKDKRKTFCIYDGPSEEAIRKAAELNHQPVDSVSEVRVLDPYFYM